MRLFDDQVKERIMKQITRGLFTLLMAALLVACSQSEETAVPPTPIVPDDEVAAPVVEQEPEAELPPPVMETIEDRDETAVAETDAPPTATALHPWPADSFGYGIQIHGNATVGDPVQTMDIVRDQLGLDWVKIQMQWWLIEPAPGEFQWFFYDGVVDEAHNHGLQLMVSIVGAPEWTRAANNHIGPPDDYEEFARFLRDLIQRHEGKIHAIEVWNEQNLDREWQTANGISPEDYVRFLQVAYEAIKAEDPDIIVISGALSPTGDGDWVRWADDFAYMDRAVAAGMLNYTDCVGAHHNGINVPPDLAYDQTWEAPIAQTAFFRGPFDNPHHSWSFKTTLEGYAQRVQAVDPNMKLCVTEFGWPSSEGYDVHPEGFGFALDNSLEDQANYIVQAFQQMRTSGDVWLAVLFNFDFGNKGSGPNDDTVPYSIIDTQGIPRPAFGAVVNMEKDLRIGQ
jgi:polysaccharide biosynthesis protein PslG